MLKVLIDGRLVEKPRGLGRYVRELLFSIGRQNLSEFDIHVLVPKGSERRVAELGAFRIISLPRWPVPVWEQMLVPWWARRLRVDVVHCPCNTASLLLSWLRVPHLVTIHDLMYFSVRGATWYQRFGNAYRRFIVSRLRSERLRVVAVSSATCENIRDRLGLNATVIHAAVTRFALGAGERKATAGETKGAPYFVHIGGLAGHKNTALVVDAFRAAALPEFRLIVLGVPADTGPAARWRAEGVIVPGWVSDEEVAAYISDATAMIFPSLMEGYGLPILEAFSLGCPVITSAVAPMDELAGDAAILVDPRSKTAVTDACRNVATDASLRAELTTRGHRRATEFSAERIGKQILAEYLRAACAARAK